MTEPARGCDEWRKNSWCFRRAARMLDGGGMVTRAGGLRDVILGGTGKPDTCVVDTRETWIGSRVTRVSKAKSLDLVRAVWNPIATRWNNGEMVLRACFSKEITIPIIVSTQRHSRNGTSSFCDPAAVATSIDDGGRWQNSNEATEQRGKSVM